MAKKSKRRAQGKRPRPTFVPPPASSGGVAVAPTSSSAATAPALAPRPGMGPRVGGNEALVRSVEMSLAPRSAGAGRKGARTQLLDGGDPAIPLDRVPYFTRDLRKLGVVAALMVVLVVAGSRLIPLLVH